MQTKEGSIIPTVIDDLKQVFHSNLGKIPSNEESLSILQALSSIRDIRKVLNSHPKHLFQVVFENGDFYNKCYLPCDILQLRDILSTGKYFSPCNIMLFSNKVWQRVIKSYKIILVLNIDPQKTDALMAGGIAILPRTELDIKSNISSVIIQRNAPYEEVESIISEYIPTCPIYDVAYVPAISNEKFADKKDFYVVNLPQLQIENQKVRANSPQDALEICLIRRWSWYHDKDNFKKRPDRFRVEFWNESPFFNSIVKKVEHKTSKIPILQNWYNTFIKYTTNQLDNNNS